MALREMTPGQVRSLEKKGYRVTEWVRERGRTRVNVVTPSGQPRTITLKGQSR